MTKQASYRDITPPNDMTTSKKFYRLTVVCLHAQVGLQLTPMSVTHNIIQSLG